MLHRVQVRCALAGTIFRSESGRAMAAKIRFRKCYFQIYRFGIDSFPVLEILEIVQSVGPTSGVYPPAPIFRLSTGSSSFRSLINAIMIQAAF